MQSIFISSCLLSSNLISPYLIFSCTKSVHRLKEFEGRLGRAASRVSFAASVMAQKEVKTSSILHLYHYHVSYDSIFFFIFLSLFFLLDLSFFFFFIFFLFLFFFFFFSLLFSLFLFFYLFLFLLLFLSISFIFSSLLLPRLTPRLLFLLLTFPFDLIQFKLM